MNLYKIVMSPDNKPYLPGKYAVMKDGIIVKDNLKSQEDAHTWIRKQRGENG